MSFEGFTNEEEKEIRHLADVLKYAKTNKKKKAQEKLFIIVNRHVDDEMKKRYDLCEKLIKELAD